MSTDKKTHHFAHHFKSAEHEYESGKEGVWVFMTSEILMFGGLFVGYIIYAGLYPEVFKEGSTHLNWKYGALNTAVLLLSSYTMVAGIYHLQKDNLAKAATNLWVTVACAVGFMCIKYIEYSHKFHLGYFPGEWMTGEANGVENLGLYFSFYFMMTGLHGIHVVVGALLIAWCAIRVKRGEFGAHRYMFVEGVGIFWHLVDLIWIFLFPLLYLV